MKLILIALLLGMAGCWSQTDGDSRDCFGIGPREGEERSCSFVAPSDPDYACEKLTAIRRNGNALSSSEVTIQCFANGDSMIIVKSDSCAADFFEACK